MVAVSSRGTAGMCAALLLMFVLRRRLVDAERAVDAENGAGVVVTAGGEQEQAAAGRAAGPVVGAAGSAGTTASAATAVSLAGTYAVVRTAQGDEVEAVWQSPPAAGGPPRALLLLAHGCNHGAIDWWPRGPGCKRCIGLPEETSITRAALRRRFFALALSSADRRGRRCWDFGDVRALAGRGSGSGSGSGRRVLEGDLRRVAGALGALRGQQPALQGLPVFVLGASSGGALALILPLAVPELVAVCAQIMAVPPSLFAAAARGDARGDGGGGGGGGSGGRGTKQPHSYRYPPATFEHMERDEGTSAGVAMDIAELKRLGVPTREVRVRARPVTAAFFSDAIDEISPAQSAALHGALQGAGYLASSSGEDGAGAEGADLLLQDPRRSDWREVLRAAPAVASVLKGDSLVADESALAEEMNVAWAMHELTAEHIEDTLSWFERVGGLSAATG
eukprot:g1590.t1